MEEQDNPTLYKIRHSLAHILAQAVKLRFPDAKLGFGPPTDTGFYYDFDFGSQKLQEDQLKDLEKTMKKIISQKQVFDLVELDFEGATQRVKAAGEDYKIENIANLKSKGIDRFTFYKNGPFEDLCEGPHVVNTDELPIHGFKLDRIAGAFWLGDEKNKMLTRIYALAFESKEELDDYLKRRKIAEEYDHKKLGKELDIFHIDELVGKGLPLWLPNGTIIRDEIEKYAREIEFKNGYKRVSTPHIASEKLYMKSQHLYSYKESMFPPMEDKDKVTGHIDRYYLKPMNCPHHHLIYSSRMRSYRDLPLRLAEYGTQYRYEQSGELSGLIRVRCMTLNDAHIYCRRDQVEQEIYNILSIYKEFYDTFRLSEYRFRLSIRGSVADPKFKGDDDMWNEGEAILKKALEHTGIPYFVGEGEAAFYGPKIDVQFKNLLGREETVSTVQIDFLGPKNFELRYIDAEGQEAVPVIIHRAPLSTHERFVSFIMEYYGGAFPTWCAPLQVSMIPVNETCYEYCQNFKEELLAQYIRAEVDDSNHSFSKKIRTNTVRKIPIVLVVGNKEVDDGTVTIRRYGFEEQQTMSKEAFVAMVTDEIKSRKCLRDPMGSII